MLSSSRPYWKNLFFYLAGEFAADLKFAEERVEPAFLAVVFQIVQRVNKVDPPPQQIAEPFENPLSIASSDKAAIIWDQGVGAWFSRRVQPALGSASTTACCWFISRQTPARTGNRLSAFFPARAVSGRVIR